MLTMKNSKKLLLFLIVFPLFFSAKAQEGLHIGPTIGGGLVVSRNFIIEESSPFYIENKAGLFGTAGLDILYGFDKNITFHLGGAFTYREFVLSPPGDAPGLSFTELSRTALSISVPMTVQYRIPLGSSEKTFAKFIVGHSLDITLADSTVDWTPESMSADSGATVIRHEFQVLKRYLPTVLLGVGLDFEADNGNVLNLTLMAGLGTGKLFRGDIREWNPINEDFDHEEVDEPQEFPDYYYDFAMRGGYFAFRLSYWFDISKLLEKDKDGDGR